MSLTEREKEIAEEVASLHDDCTDAMHLTVYRDDVVVMFNEFLSRIREGQEAVAWLVPDGTEWFPSKRALSNNSIPLFAIPPAAPECEDLEMIKRMMETGTADSFMSLNDEQKRMAFAVGVHESTLRKKLADDCSELVEALEKIVYWQSSLSCPASLIENAKELITKHKAMMGEK